MENKLEHNADFERVEVVRSLFNRCSLAELQAIQIMVNDGTVRRFVGKKLSDRERKQLEGEIIVNSIHTKLLTTNQL